MKPATKLRRHLAEMSELLSSILPHVDEIAALCDMGSTAPDGYRRGQNAGGPMGKGGYSDPTGAAVAGWQGETDIVAIWLQGLFDEVTQALQHMREMKRLATQIIEASRTVSPLEKKKPPNRKRPGASLALRNGITDEGLVATFRGRP